jgi:hypothetical protein
MLKWFEPFLQGKPNKTRRSIYKRTVLQTYQGGEGTCYAHMGARLILQNILRLKDEEKYFHHWKYRSVCRKMLNTYKPPVPTKELKQCGSDGFLKISMFLYLYYLIVERYGIDGGALFQCVSIYPSVKQKERPKQFTEAYQSMYTTVDTFLSHHKPTPFYFNQVFIPDSKLEDAENIPLFDLILLFLENNMYIGCRFYTGNDVMNGHLFILTGYSASQNAFYVKNSWGMFVSMLKASEIGKNTITFDTDKMKARVNMFGFVYTRKKGPLYFDTVTPEIVEEFKHELKPRSLTKKLRA